MGAWRAWRWLGLLPLMTLIWHGIHTVDKFGSQYLLFACYPANLLLGLGILSGVTLCAGVGAFFSLAALPLYLHYASTTPDWALSGVAFHIVGATVGGLCLAMVKPSRYTWVVACLCGFLLQGAARLFTDPTANVNVAFDTFGGRHDVFPNFGIYLVAVYSFFGLSFLGLQAASIWIYNRRSRHG